MVQVLDLEAGCDKALVMFVNGPLSGYVEQVTASKLTNVYRMDATS